ncbi:recombinase family protein [Pseudooceanicola atlanticus]|jgi:DNA invertase Pin-like site-specific DNA recombinase|uniref:recombinase family protein n=1 Tax=Pseudooceanicola atlanticus TaxID=1461694 RepID=UPI002356B50E|nr:recombinase family protein [Pseudooceanicola atlanticus]
MSEATGRKIGYLRVSTAEQRTDRQAFGLEGLCDELHVEYVSAVAGHRPVFENVMAKLSWGDTLMVWDLDRAFRSTIDALVTAETLRKRGVHLRIAKMNIDTGTEEGELFYTMIAAFARFERRMLARRTREGLAAAKQNGTRLGRPPALDAETVAEAYENYYRRGYPCRYIAFLLGVSRITLERAFHRGGFRYPT